MWFRAQLPRPAAVRVGRPSAINTKDRAMKRVSAALSCLVLAFVLYGCWGKTPEATRSPISRAPERYPLPDQLPPPLPKDSPSPEMPESSPTPEEILEEEWIEEAYEPEMNVTPTPGPVERKQQRKEKRKEKQKAFRAGTDEISKELELSPDQRKLFRKELKTMKKNNRVVRKQIAGILTEDQNNKRKQMRKTGRFDRRQLGLSDQQLDAMKAIKKEQRRRRDASDQRLGGILSPDQMENYRRIRKEKKRAKQSKSPVVKGSR
jgi:hypothetical protein